MDSDVLDMVMDVREFLPERDVKNKNKRSENSIQIWSCVIQYRQT